MFSKLFLSIVLFCGYNAYTNTAVPGEASSEHYFSTPLWDTIDPQIAKLKAILAQETKREQLDNNYVKWIHGQALTGSELDALKRDVVKKEKYWTSRGGKNNKRIPVSQDEGVDLYLKEIRNKQSDVFEIALQKKIKDREKTIERNLDAIVQFIFLSGGGFDQAQPMFEHVIQELSLDKKKYSLKSKKAFLERIRNSPEFSEHASKDDLLSFDYAIKRLIQAQPQDLKDHETTFIRINEDETRPGFLSLETLEYTGEGFHLLSTAIISLTYGATTIGALANIPALEAGRLSALHYFSNWADNNIHHYSTHKLVDNVINYGGNSTENVKAAASAINAGTLLVTGLTAGSYMLGVVGAPAAVAFYALVIKPIRDRASERFRATQKDSRTWVQTAIEQLWKKKSTLAIIGAGALGGLWYLSPSTAGDLVRQGVEAASPLAGQIFNETMIDSLRTAAGATSSTRRRDLK